MRISLSPELVDGMHQRIKNERPSAIYTRICTQCKIAKHPIGGKFLAIENSKRKNWICSVCKGNSQ